MPIDCSVNDRFSPGPSKIRIGRGSRHPRLPRRESGRGRGRRTESCPTMSRGVRFDNCTGARASRKRPRITRIGTNPEESPRNTRNTRNFEPKLPGLFPLFHVFRVFRVFRGKKVVDFLGDSRDSRARTRSAFTSAMPPAARGRGPEKKNPQACRGSHAGGLWRVRAGAATLEGINPAWP
jgi:hypothetical protein